MKFRSDGSIQSSATPTYQNVARREDYGLYRCMVTKVVYVDDPANIASNSQTPRVMYDVVVLGGFASGQIISNCRLASDLGGNDSYWERTLRASEKEVSNSRLAECDGDIVYVQFNQGHTGFPVITCLDQGIDLTKSKIANFGTKKASGPRSIRLFNGVFEEIDKDGQLTQMIHGGKANADKGSFAAAAKPLVTTKTSKDEKITRTYKGGLIIEEDGANDKITKTFKGGLIIVEDGKTDTVTHTLKGGVKITTDGKNDVVKIETKGGATATIDGQNDNIKLVASGTGELNIKGGKVALGASSAELLQQISDQLDKITKFLQTTDALHTHLGNLGYPTLLPIETAQFIQLATDLTLIKGKVDGIKGTL